ncbi:MAG TPA: hypothetical protein VFV00_07390 [Acidimicrobiales bacterium]|nr:hypothetical protein [Acidimicrobiales bacterium]
MLTIAVILAIWVVLSLPLSVVLGHSMSTPQESELLGMDGDVAVFRRADGRIERVSLTARTSA